MVALSGVSSATTSPDIRRANYFSCHPIYEVAAVCAGIFLAMIPALDLLRPRAGALGIGQPWQYFWATGALLSFLDKALRAWRFSLWPGPEAYPRGRGRSRTTSWRRSALARRSCAAIPTLATDLVLMVRSIAERRSV